MANRLLTESEAREVLAPFLPDLRKAVEEGWKAWANNPARTSASKRTRASLIHDEITNQLERTYASHDRVRVRRRDNSLHMSIDSLVTIRVKMLHRRGLNTSGIMTNARANFLAQRGDLPGTPLTNLVLGYRLDDLELGIQQIYLTCPLMRRNLWVIELAEAPAASVSLFDAQEPADEGTIVRSVIVPTGDTKIASEE